MSVDFFASNTISLVLSWIFSAPLILGLAGLPFVYIFSVLKDRDSPCIFSLWIMLCLLVLSPVRYIALQVILAIAFPLQSLSALLSTLLLALYIPIVGAILLAIGVGLPLLAIAAITGFSDVSSKGRRFLAAISAPLLLVIGSFFYYSVLPYAAYSTHWLNHKDVIRATNGPAEYFYRYVVEQGTPLLFEEFALEVGLENLPAKERLRAHVATLYLGNKQFAYYLYKEYPYYYEKKQR